MTSKTTTTITKTPCAGWHQKIDSGLTDDVYIAANNWHNCAIGEALNLADLPYSDDQLAAGLSHTIPEVQKLGYEFPVRLPVRPNDDEAIVRTHRFIRKIEDGINAAKGGAPATRARLVAWLKEMYPSVR